MPMPVCAGALARAHTRSHGARAISDYMHAGTDATQRIQEIVPDAFFFEFAVNDYEGAAVFVGLVGQCMDM